nr:MAG TPA: hypothetical protein [Caudoviricetes sp.]
MSSLLDQRLRYEYNKLKLIKYNLINLFFKRIKKN